MSRLNYHRKTFAFDEKCFPRIYYFKTRLRRIYPRLKAILDFEFKHRGIRKMRSDDEELRAIWAKIDKRTCIECLSTDPQLLSKLTVSKLAINTEFASAKRASYHHGRSENQRDITENSVIIIVTLIKDLCETLELLAEGSWVKSFVIAVFVEDSDDLQRYRNSLEAAKKTCTEVVIVKPHDYDLASNKTARLKNISERLLKSRSPSPQRSASTSPARSPSRSTVVRSSAREMSPVQSSSQKSSSRMLSLPGSSQGSLSTLPGKTSLTEDFDPENVSKKSKRDLGEKNVTTSSYQRQESHEYMDTDDTDNYLQDFQRSETRRDKTEMSKGKISFRNITHWDTCDLKQIASFKLEVQVISIVEHILTLLKNVKMRGGEPNASVTTLDKLIFEVEGLLSQSKTESGTKMKEEIERQQLPPNLMDDILRVNGVYSCGTLYGRLNIHIEVDDGNKRKTMQDEIKDILLKYNYRDMDYEMKIVKSRPTTYSSLVICPA